MWWEAAIVFRSSRRLETRDRVGGLKLSFSSYKAIPDHLGRMASKGLAEGLDREFRLGAALSEKPRQSPWADPLINPSSEAKPLTRSTRYLKNLPALNFSPKHYSGAFQDTECQTITPSWPPSFMGWWNDNWEVSEAPSYLSVCKTEMQRQCCGGAREIQVTLSGRPVQIWSSAPMETQVRRLHLALAGWTWV